MDDRCKIKNISSINVGNLVDRERFTEQSEHPDSTTGLTLMHLV